MTTIYKPTIMISACLLGTRCRYDGSDVYQGSVPQLLRKFVVIPICPEIMAGMQIPRDAVELVDGRAMTQGGEDQTSYFDAGAMETLRLAKLLQVKRAVLKSGSPSCGCDYIYDGTFSDRLIRGMGITARVLHEHGIIVHSEYDDIIKI